MFQETHKELEVYLFENSDLWSAWLEERAGRPESIWLKIAKKSSPVGSVTYEEAREAAIRFGWIDGLINRFDENYYLLKFSPRRPRSKWSKINRAIAEELIAAGTMRPSGLAQVEAARSDGRWEAAYDPPSTMQVPEDFQELLAQFPDAQAFFSSLSKSQRYAVCYRLQDAKRPETRERRKQQFLQSLLSG